MCAVAGRCQRDLQVYTRAYPELFAGSQFDGALLSGIALANAFGSPWANAAQLRTACHATLWVFAADWMVDVASRSRDDLHRELEDCFAVVDRGRSGDGPLARFLADLEGELAATPSFAAAGERWREQVRTCLGAMAREWDWKTSGALPTLEEYLGNAANFGSSLVNLSHWIAGADSRGLTHLDELLTISDETQRILRLLNDLATYERDLTWGPGDLNALILGVDRDGVERRIAELTRHCRHLMLPLARVCPVHIRYLERQIAYSTGFYGWGDYWGRLEAVERAE